MDDSLYGLYQDFEFGQYYRQDPLSNLLGIYDSLRSDEHARSVRAMMNKNENQEREIIKEYNRVGVKSNDSRTIPYNTINVSGGARSGKYKRKPVSSKALIPISNGGIDKYQFHRK